MLTRTTLVLDDLFDPRKGWDFPAHQVPIERSAAHDGNPMYVLNVDGIEVVVFEVTKWAEGSRETVPAMRVSFVIASELEVADARVLAEANMETLGLPAWAVDDEGEIDIAYSLPFSEDFPVEFLRKQLLVAIALAVGAVRELRADVEDSERARPAARWNQARNVASVAGTFARAFFL